MGLLIIAIIIIAIAVFFLSSMARVAVRPKVHTLEYELNTLKKHDYMKDERIDWENEHKVKSFDGYELWTAFVPGNPESKHYVILSHGYTSTRYGMYKYVVLWRKLGYNCVIYDNRGHGVNEPAMVSFGWRECKDLMAVIEDTYNRYGKDIHIGLHGESMGAGLQLMALALKPKVDFIVNDCGYSEILPVLRWKVGQAFHMPNWLPDLASPFARLLFGFSFKEVRPIDNLKDNEIPICFVHGKTDTFTHPWHSEKMYEANKGYKELHLYEDAEHAESVVVDNKRYQKMLQEFVAKVYA